MGSSSVSGSERPPTRRAGLSYLAVIAAGAFAEFYVRGAVVVRGDAAATAGNILRLEFLYRLGFVAYLIDMALYVYVTVVLYELFRPVNARLSLLAAAFSLVASAVGAFTTMFHFFPLLLLHGEPYLAAFTPTQLQALSLLSLKAHLYAYHIALALFAAQLLIVGVLILSSRLFPWVVGLLLAIGGGVYLAISVMSFLAPALAALAPVYVMAPAVAGEFLLALWMLMFGVNASHWRQVGRVGLPQADTRG